MNLSNYEDTNPVPFDLQPVVHVLSKSHNPMRRFAKIAPILAFLGAISSTSAAPDSIPSVTASPPAKVMSVGEMNVAAASLEAGMEEDGQQVVHLQEVAKKAKDVIKLNCVNDRLVQVKAQRNIADQTRNQLDVALAKNSDERSSLFASYEGTARTVKDLREQSKACIGEPELFKQESGVTVDRPETPDDPTVNPPLSDNGIEPPGYASPWI